MSPKTFSIEDLSDPILIFNKLHENELVPKQILAKKINKNKNIFFILKLYIFILYPGNTTMLSSGIITSSSSNIPQE
tara:strand:- start:19 stop:249 length:231 start_codon:yes stop_codon:yes gene_type:complete